MKKAIADAIEDRGYDTLTAVQLAVTQPEHLGADLLVSAQTGSGKTLGFGLAIAPTILRDAETFDEPGAPLALVIAPTRELAMQVRRELGWLYAKAGAVLASCVGGMDMRDERRALARGAHIVVATPGRLRDHIMRGAIDLGQLRAVVLDEADEMLDLGFREDLEFILGEAPAERQTLMFSATIPPSIARLAQSYQKDAVRVVTKSESTQHADIEYRALTASERDAESAVINTLRYYEAPNAIVFCNTRAVVARLTSRLSNRGFQVVALSGELSQSERTHALQAMRDGRARVCVATDVAARGIDLPNLDLVVHAELPSNHETLLHRSGRTGRAGRKGVSALIVTHKSRRKAERILAAGKVRAEWAGAPSADEVQARDEERMLADPAWQDEVPETERAIVEALIARFSPEQLAAAYLRLYRAQHSAPEDVSAEIDAPAPRTEFGPCVWFSLSTGRSQNAEPRRLLPMLCKAGDLSKQDIGAIRVREDVSFVEIREASVEGFLAAIGSGMTVEDGVTLTRLPGPPEGLRAPRSDAPRPKPPRRDPRPALEARPEPRRAPEPSHSPRPEVQAAPPPAPTPAPEPQPQPQPASRGTTTAIDWNDAPTPRKRKPKPGSRPEGGKPRRAETPSPEVRAKAEAVRPLAPRGASDTSKSFRKDKPRSGDKGPPPPAGKPSSKKNRARAAAAATARGKDRPRQAPRPGRGPGGGKPGGPRRTKS